MARLSINIDHIATLREARKTLFPDPVAAAILVELAGADGVVVHLREDRRHIHDRDVRLIRQTIQTRLILEMAATDEMVDIALDVKPDLVTLVPEKRKELTTEGGIDVVAHQNEIEKKINQLQKGKIKVSLFVNPEPEQIKTAQKINADMVEIHTGRFCDAESDEKKEEMLRLIVDGARLARNLKLGVNAGHGLNYTTIKAFKGVSEISEFSIGHSIIARAVLVGLERAVREMIAIIHLL
ncbi:MAG: pyridoxine 5'-phosphate synthase [Pseudomonadota bacterium]